MTRDLDLIREILLEVESANAGRGFNYDRDTETITEYARPADQVKMQHANLLIEADYLVGNGIKLGDGSLLSVYVERMTMKGHDFLDTIKSDTVWKKTRKKITSTVGTTSLTVISAVAEGITKAMLTGQPPQ